MSRVGSKDSAVELIVRRIVHALGYGYRLHRRELPGTPDLVFAGRKKAIFVHGCFWHRHSCPSGQSMPRTNVAFWKRKFRDNRERDRHVLRQLEHLGWEPLVVWECEVKLENRRNDLIEQLHEFLRST